MRYLPVVHPTEPYFPTVAGVIATLLVALVFGWQRPRRPLGRFGIAYAFSLFFFVPAAFWVAFDGMTKAPIFPEEFAYYFTAGVAWMLLFALEVAFFKRAENLEDRVKPRTRDSRYIRQTLAHGGVLFPALLGGPARATPSEEDPLRSCPQYRTAKA